MFFSSIFSIFDFSNGDLIHKWELDGNLSDVKSGNDLESIGGADLWKYGTELQGLQGRKFYNKSTSSTDGFL